MVSANALTAPYLRHLFCTPCVFGNTKDGAGIKEKTALYFTDRALYSDTHEQRIIHPQNLAQGQLTLPSSLRDRLHVHPGSRITVDVIGVGRLRISSEPPITKYFGKLAGAWTSGGEDAAAYARNLCDEMQPRL
jgi:bifunctional DNA-binding transcriptional regulator/antitoxin component of YhaV-PrlF toxin-antitoxin module